MFPSIYISAHPFDLIRIYIGHRHFYSGRQIDNEFIVLIGINHIDYGITDIFGKIQLSSCKTFRRILIPDFCTLMLSGNLLDKFSSFNSNGYDLLTAFIKYHISLNGRCRIVKVNYGLFGPFNRFERSLNQMITGLSQNLNCYIFGNPVLFYQSSQKYEFSF